MSNYVTLLVVKKSVINMGTKMHKNLPFKIKVKENKVKS
jgi:hypothetical protein